MAQHVVELVNSTFICLLPHFLGYKVHSLAIILDPVFWIKQSVYSQIVSLAEALHTGKTNQICVCFCQDDSLPRIEGT